MRLSGEQLFALFVVRENREYDCITVRYMSESGSQVVRIPYAAILFECAFGESASLLSLTEVKLDTGWFVPREQFSGSKRPVVQSEAEARLLKIFHEEGPMALASAKAISFVRALDVDDEGYWHIEGLGRMATVVGVKLDPPGSEVKSEEVIMMYHVQELGLGCAHCGAEMQLGRCVFLTDGGFEVYPCNICEEWVWVYPDNYEEVE